MLNIINKSISIGQIDESKMQVEVIVRMPGVPDFDGDITTEEEVIDMAHSYPYWGNVDAYHNFNVSGSFIESYISKEETIQELPNGKTLTIPKGTWIAVLKINDAAVWANIKNGIITGASLVAVPAKIPTEDGVGIPLRDKKWEIDDIFKYSNGLTFEEKMNRINMIYSNQSVTEKGAGGGTTINALKQLGYGIEVICISLVESPNQQEAQVISVKSIGNMISEAFLKFKNEFIGSLKSTTTTIKEKGVEIMTVEELLAALASDQSLIDAIKAIATEAPKEEIKEEVKEEVKEEIKEENKTENQALLDKIAELETKLEAAVTVKSRAINDATETHSQTQKYERKRRNGAGSL